MMFINRLTILILTFLILGSVVFFYTFTKKNSHDVVYLFSAAKNYAEKKNFKDSIATYERILSLQPKNTDARLALARTLSWDQQYDKSESLIQDILKEEPQNSEAWMILARMYHWQGKRDEAKKIAKDILARNPSNSEAQELLTTIQTQEKD
ncbi:MAG: tetratricopeptide repeat protein [Deltaproteobacteria bacterium]|nr:tetratricopeptide repeat protein [Deltaproteobacteria bacterium]